MEILVSQGGRQGASQGGSSQPGHLTWRALVQRRHYTS